MASYTAPLLCLYDVGIAAAAAMIGWQSSPDSAAKWAVSLAVSAHLLLLRWTYMPQWLAFTRSLLSRYQLLQRAAPRLAFLVLLVPCGLQALATGWSTWSGQPTLLPPGPRSAFLLSRFTTTWSCLCAASVITWWWAPALLAVAVVVSQVGHRWWGGSPTFSRTNKSTISRGVSLGLLRRAPQNLEELLRELELEPRICQSAPPSPRPRGSRPAAMLLRRHSTGRTPPRGEGGSPHSSPRKCPWPSQPLQPAAPPQWSPRSSFESAGDEASPFETHLPLGVSGGGCSPFQALASSGWPVTMACCVGSSGQPEARMVRSVSIARAVSPFAGMACRSFDEDEEEESGANVASLPLPARPPVQLLSSRSAGARVALEDRRQPCSPQHLLRSPSAPAQATRHRLSATSLPHVSASNMLHHDGAASAHGIPSRLYLQDVVHNVSRYRPSCGAHLLSRTP